MYSFILSSTVYFLESSGAEFSRPYQEETWLIATIDGIGTGIISNHPLALQEKWGRDHTYLMSTLY